MVAAGSGRVLESGERVALEVKTGDRIIFSKYAGTEVKYEGTDYLILRESDILAVIGLCAHVFERVFKLDFFRDGYTVVCD